MLANNGLIAINLAYQNLDRAFVKDITDIESKLTLAPHLNWLLKHQLERVYDLLSYLR